MGVVSLAPSTEKHSLQKATRTSDNCGMWATAIFTRQIYMLPGQLGAMIWGWESLPICIEKGSEACIWKEFNGAVASGFGVPLDILY